MGDAHRADILLIGQVITLDPVRPTAEADAVQGDEILAVGRLDDLRSIVSPRTVIVDAGDDLILPAFHDAHLHLLEYARAAGRLDCSAIGSPESLSEALRHEHAALPPGAWLVAHRLDEK